MTGAGCKPVAARFDFLGPALARHRKRRNVDEVRWVEVDMSAHAFHAGRLRSLCGLIRLPVGFKHGDGAGTDRCKTCQRAVIHQLSKQWAANEDPAVRWRERATNAVLGDHWTYDELANMPTWKETVDRVAVELAEAFREGLVQGAGQ